MQFIRSAIFAITLCGSIFAQSTWIVDVANGAGSHFSDIQSAVQAAKHGDLILIRRGTYFGPVACSKGVRIVALSGATLMNTKTSGFTLQVSRIPAGQSFSMTGLTVGHGAYNPTRGLLMLSNLGTLSFSDVTFSSPRGMDIFSCASVTMTSCHITGQLRCSQSHITMSSSSIEGGSWTPESICELDRTTFVLANSSVRPHKPTSSIKFNGLAVSARQSTIRLHAGCDLETSTAYPLEVLIAKGSSTLIVDPSVVLKPSGRAQDFTGFLATTRPLPTLSVQAQGVGSPIALQITQPLHWLWILQVGTRGVPLTVGPFGELSIDFGTLMILGAGVSTRTTTKMQIPTPSVPALRGIPFAYQTASGAWPTLEYSNVVGTMLY
ncbi:MAG: hypothetical protein KDC95_01080 [Planctomycetes bacterium]|nr:hypothetical protein [Planctomycetota bacterium]